MLMVVFYRLHRQSVFYNLVHGKIVGLKVVAQNLSHCAKGYRTHQLGTGYADPILRGFPFHSFHDHGNGGFFIVGQIHGYLNHTLLFQREPDGPHIPESAVDEADSFGNALGDFDIGRCQINVEGHQRKTG